MNTTKPISTDIPSIRGIRKLTQIAVITRDTEKMALTLNNRLQLGAFKIFTAKAPQLFNAKYNGVDNNWSMKAGLTWLGDVQVEIIQPLSGNTVYNDYLNDRDQNAGIEHVYFDALRFEDTLGLFNSIGFPLKQEAQLNASGKIGIMPIPALPSFLNHLAAKFGYTSTIRELKLDLEIAKFPKGVTQRFALKAAKAEKWIPYPNPSLFEKSPKGAPLVNVSMFYIFTKDLDETIGQYSKLTDGPIQTESIPSSHILGAAKLARIAVGKSQIILLEPIEGKSKELINNYGEGLILLGAQSRKPLNEAKKTLKNLGWDIHSSDPNDPFLAVVHDVPFAILVNY